MNQVCLVRDTECIHCCGGSRNKLGNVQGYYSNLGSLRYGNDYCIKRRCMGKKLFSSSTEAYLNHAVITAR